MQLLRCINLNFSLGDSKTTFTLLNLQLCASLTAYSGFCWACRVSSAMTRRDKCDFTERVCSQGEDVSERRRWVSFSATLVLVLVTCPRTGHSQSFWKLHKALLKLSSIFWLHLALFIADSMFCLGFWHILKKKRKKKSLNLQNSL